MASAPSIAVCTLLADSCAIAWQACLHLPNRAGKTTVLEMLLHWLRKYLWEHKEQSLLHFFCGAMYPDRDPRALLREEKEGEEKRVVEDFLEALKQIASSPHLLALLR